MFEQTKTLCDSFLKLGIPGFDLAVNQNGTEILRYMRGFSDPERQIPVNGTEKYYIYSCSKPITCAAAMQLWERGLFSLDDPLCRYLPEFAEMQVQTPDGVRTAEQPILIGQIFDMTAGFSYELHSPSLEQFRIQSNHLCPTRETVAQLAKEPLLFEPGAQWNYSLCHDILAALVEVVSSQNFADYVAEHIFRQLHMDDSTFLPSEAEKAALCPQFRYDEATGALVDHGTKNEYVFGSQYASGGAGCVSTVADYMKFLEALRTADRILKKETIELMCVNRLSAQQLQTYTHAENYGYGLGIRTPNPGGNADFGWGGAAGAYLAVDIPNGITLYYAQHVLGSPIQAVRRLLYEAVLADLQGRTIRLPKTIKPDHLTY